MRIEILKEERNSTDTFYATRIKSAGLIMAFLSEKNDCAILSCPQTQYHTVHCADPGSPVRDRPTLHHLRYLFLPNCKRLALASKGIMEFQRCVITGREEFVLEISHLLEVGTFLLYKDWNHHRWPRTSKLVIILSAICPARVENRHS
jgi:hypothetical protein